MPAKIAILYPSIVMALFTLSLIASLGLRRYAWVQQRKVNPKYYWTFDQGEEPPPLRKHTRNVQNHFELPPLFHIAVWGTYLAGEVSGVTLFAAWFFVAARCVHSVIHMTYNTVIHRFLVYGFSLFALVFLWVRLAMSIGKL